MNRHDLRKNVSYHRIENFNLFIVPALPSWFVLTDNQALAFDLYLKDYCKKEVVEHLYNEGMDKIEAINAYDGLLKILKSRKLLSNNTVFIAPDADEYPTNIHLALTHHCNLRCKHCYISAGIGLQRELKLKDWEKGFNNLFSIVPKPDITISGGEPTVIKYLPELIEYLKTKAEHLVFYTNGTNPIGSISGLVNEVQVSLEGLSDKTNDYIRGKGTYKKVMNYISDFPDKDKLKIALTIMYHNFREIKLGLKKWLAASGLNMSNMRFNAELEVDGRAEGLPDEFLDFQYKNAIPIFNFIADHTDKDIEPTILLKNMRNCGIGISIGVDSNGDIYPCDAFINRQGNILDSNIEEILKNCLSINKYSEIDGIKYCSDCDLKYICLGGCKAKNYKMNGSYLNPVCDERSKYIKYVQMIHNVGL